jgi:hypothetical protein
VACVVRVVRRLDLNVSPTMSEALGFFDHRTRGAPPLPPELCVDIDGEEVPVRSQMRYLGLTVERMDVRSTLRSAGPESDGSSQRLVRFTAEHRKSRNQNAPPI